MTYPRLGNPQRINYSVSKSRGQQILLITLKIGLVDKILNSLTDWTERPSFFLIILKICITKSVKTCFYDGN